MKYALVFALVLVVLWGWRASRKARLSDRESRTNAHTEKTSTAVTEIVACKFCSVHLPRQDALTGSRGLYCSAAHRQNAGD